MPDLTGQDSEAVSPAEPRSAEPDSASELRRKILAIHADTSSSDAVKARRIQALLSGQSSRPSGSASGAASNQGSSSDAAAGAGSGVSNESQFSANAPGSLDDATGDATGPSLTVRSLSRQTQHNKPGEFSDNDKICAYHNEENTVLGCKHYMRSVKLQAHCCGKWVVCRFCHDEVSDHAIVRQKTRFMMCMRCYHVQPCSQVCANEACGARVSRYYCDDCKLWDDDEKKNIYHCNDCGICRIGRGLGKDYFHCKKCNVCMAIALRDRHKCIERNLESDCPICGEYMFTSTTTVIFMPCGHCIHHRCYQEHTQTSFTCPTCCKSLGAMREYFSRVDAALAFHNMPPEYESQMSYIFCNDCEKRSSSNYHFMYHKCSAVSFFPEGSNSPGATSYSFPLLGLKGTSSGFNFHLVDQQRILYELTVANNPSFDILGMMYLKQEALRNMQDQDVVLLEFAREHYARCNNNDEPIEPDKFGTLQIETLMSVSPTLVTQSVEIFKPSPELANVLRNGVLDPEIADDVLASPDLFMRLVALLPPIMTIDTEINGKRGTLRPCRSYNTRILSTYHRETPEEKDTLRRLEEQTQILFASLRQLEN